MVIAHEIAGILMLAFVPWAIWIGWNLTKHQEVSEKQRSEIVRVDSMVVCGRVKNLKRFISSLRCIDIWGNDVDLPQRLSDIYGYNDEHEVVIKITDAVWWFGDKGLLKEKCKKYDLELLSVQYKEW